MLCEFRTVLRNTILRTIVARFEWRKPPFLTRDNVALSRVMRLVITQSTGFGETRGVLKIDFMLSGIASRAWNVAANGQRSARLVAAIQVP